MERKNKKIRKCLDVKQITDFLERNQITDTAFAAMVGCHYNSVRRMLKGHVPSTDMLSDLAKAMNVSDPWKLLK